MRDEFVHELALSSFLNKSNLAEEHAKLTKDTVKLLMRRLSFLQNSQILEDPSHLAGFLREDYVEHHDYLEGFEERIKKLEIANQNLIRATSQNNNNNNSNLNSSRYVGGDAERKLAEALSRRFETRIAKIEAKIAEPQKNLEDRLAKIEANKNNNI